jgi:hypothetical protein
MSALLKEYLATLTEPLVLLDGTAPGFADSVDLPPEVARVVLGTDVPLELGRAHKGMVLCVPDRSALRRIVPIIPKLGNARSFIVYLQRAEEPIVVVPRPEWPRLRNLVARRSPEGDAITVVRLEDAISATPVFVELARAVTRQHERGEGGLVLGLLDPPVDQLPYGDSGTVLGASLADLASDEVEVPPDVVLTSAGSFDDNAVLGRTPLTVDLRTEPTAIDELVINPVGYVHEPAQPVTTVQKLGATYRIKAGNTDVLVDAVIGLTEPHLAPLRQVRGVEVTWPAAETPGLTRLVAGLAMAGVPVVSDAVPTWASSPMGELVPLLTSKPDLDDMLRRDEHSVRLRRAAFADHSLFAWRSRLAAAAGVAGPAYPSVSVLLATKRPHQVRHALEQVRRQRGADVELVLATHGFTVDPAEVKMTVGDLPVVHLDFPEDAYFGDVLTAAARAASGDVLLKMDDDDWYGPDAITDLLLARHYSGAPVVGMPAEFLYVEPEDTTIRRNDQSEFYARFVAGGTIMIDRGLLRSVGWFRKVRKYVDLQVLTAVHAAGASVYRTHGLGYVMRRTAEGHTWNPGIDYFLTEERVGTRWEGFRPSELLEA